MAIEATDKIIFIKIRRRRKVKKRQYELRRLRRLAKAKPRHKVYTPPRASKGGSGSNDQSVSHVFQINAPKDFRLLKNTEECVKFFKKVRDRHKAFTNKVGILEVHIDLSAVMHIDFASTMMLDAICDELSSTPPLCNVWGNAPLRPDCRQYLIDSGFLSNKVDALGRDYGLVGNSDTLTTTDNLRQNGIKVGLGNADNLNGVTLAILHIGMGGDLQTKQLASLDGIISMKLVSIVGGTKQKHGTTSISLQVLNR